MFQNGANIKNDLLELGEAEKRQIDEEIKKPVPKQIILGLLTNFSNIAPSMSIGFSAVALPILASTLSPEQCSWFASIASLATPFGCLFSGPICDKFGRKSALFTTNIISLIGWLTISLAYYLTITIESQFILLLIGRVFTGLSTGLSSMPANIYMAEISSSKLRGVFCTWNTIAFSIGVLIVYALGYILHSNWGGICLITSILPCFGFIFTLLLVPESPAWLVSKSRYKEARLNLTKIYGANFDSNQIDREIELLIKSKRINPNQNHNILRKKLNQLFEPICLRPFILILIYFVFQQFSGTLVIVFYAINIVQDAGVQIDAYLMIVLIGFVRLFSAILVSYVCKIFGRRSLSITSGCGMTISMISLAIYINFVSKGNFTYIPIILILLYFLTSTLGFLPLPFAMCAEVFPSKIRGTACGLITCFAYFFNFIIVKIYPNMVEGLGKEGVFIFYGATSLIGTIFIIVFLPETKGKTLKEIEEYFGGKSNNDS